MKTSEWNVFATRRGQKRFVRFAAEDRRWEVRELAWPPTLKNQLKTEGDEVVDMDTGWGYFSKALKYAREERCWTARKLRDFFSALDTWDDVV